MTASQAQPQTARLRRALGLGAVLFYCFGDILGAGIYALVGEIAGVAGAATPLAFLLAMLAASLTALAYAELGTRHPRSGAEVAFVARAYRNDFWSLTVGLLVLCSAIVSSATVSHAFAGYLGELAPAVPDALWIALFLLAVACINFIGIEESSRTNIVFTCIELGGLVLVAVLGIWFLGRGGAAVPAETATMGAALESEGLRPIVAGAALAFFAFIGFEDVINVAEEVRDPRRSFPRALVGALALAGVVYLAVSWIAVRVVGSEALASSDAPLLQVVATAAPSMPDWIFGTIATFAVANTGLLNSITASRLLYGTASQGRLPGWLTAVHAERQTPHRAILVVLVLSAVLAYSGSLVFLAGTTAVLLLTVFSTVHLGLLIQKLRERRTEPASGDDGADVFRVPLVVPLVGLIVSVLLIFFVPVPSLLRGAGILALVGFVAWLGSRGRSDEASVE